MRLLLIAFLFLSACTSASYSQIPWNGGDVYPIIRDVERRRQMGETVVIDRDCYSACTFYLRIAECVDPKIDFYFHAPRDKNTKDRLIPVFERMVINDMKKQYNKKLASWFELVYPRTYGSNWAKVSGTQMVEVFGYDSC